MDVTSGGRKLGTATKGPKRTKYGSERKIHGQITSESRAGPGIDAGNGLMTDLLELEGQTEDHLLLHTTQTRLHLVTPHLYYNLMMRVHRLEVQDEPRRWQRPRTRASNRVI